jgi:predicted nucleic acid-binding protein
MDRIFIDSNIWVYLFSHEEENKREIAESFITNQGNANTIIVTYQVINEVTSVLKKRGFTEQDIKSTIEFLMKICVVQDYSKEMLLLASRLRDDHSFSFWDSHIVAGALLAQCTRLASEDMHDGFTIDGLTINNIF